MISVMWGRAGKAREGLSEDIKCVCMCVTHHLVLLTHFLLVLGDVPWLQEECEEIKSHECPAG